MADKRSGNPSQRAQGELTVKQQREQKRREKLEEYQRQLARQRRRGIFTWVIAGVSVVVIAAVVVLVATLGPGPRVSYTAHSSTGAEIEGVETFEHSTQHVEGVVNYAQTPPAGGQHNQYWLNCGTYTEPQQNEYAVHSLEHGAIWVTYDPELVEGDELDTLKSHLPSSYYILSPYPGMDTPIALSAWNAQLKLDSADDERIPEFFTEYWRSQFAPEPNATCSGAIDGEGQE